MAVAVRFVREIVVALRRPRVRRRLPPPVVIIVVVQAIQDGAGSLS